MTNWAEIRAELDQMLELERSATHPQRQLWQRLLHQNKRLQILLTNSVQWLGLSHIVTTQG